MINNNLTVSNNRMANNKVIQNRAMAHHRGTDHRQDRIAMDHPKLAASNMVNKEVSLDNMMQAIHKATLDITAPATKTLTVTDTLKLPKANTGSNKLMINNTLLANSPRSLPSRPIPMLLTMIPTPRR